MEPNIYLISRLFIIQKGQENEKSTKLSPKLFSFHDELIDHALIAPLHQYSLL